ncbi:PAC2 family protein [Demequina sediminicola]|uniref:PAC2 family protein n=1 Tax=Demequina sediminicola TaxID=1095026 RepID=UPI000780E54A|nr:PAC2 family protein [Demequina sediminicola]
MTPDDLTPVLGPDDSVMLAAFEGWNDAGCASTAATDHLAAAWNAKEHATLDPEDYHDFQVSRPTISRDSTGERVVSWPGTIISTADVDGAPRLAIARGIEPSMRWRTFCKEILDHAENLGVSTLVTCGALLVDVPHTRPLPTFLTSEQEATRARFGLEKSDYEGPTGIVGVLAHEAQQRGISVLSLWVGVPHYLGHPPSPKATAALLVQLERLFDTSIDLGELIEEADAWVRGADELAADDEEISAHVEQLEALMDETSLPEASGDAIAAEFERFLRRRGGGGPKSTD